MQNIKLLIAEDNIDFVKLLRTFIEQKTGFEIVATAKDGIEALEKIAKTVPDVVLLDMVMPNLDGIGVLERFNIMNPPKRPIFIVLSAIGQDVSVLRAITMGADYYIVKPFDFETLLTRIRQIFDENNQTSQLQNIQQNNLLRTGQNQKEYNLEVEVTSLLHEAGIPPHMIGYRYLREAVIISVNSTNPFTSITKVLYPAIAERFSSTSQKVERAIRNCIEKAWLKRNHDTVDSLFGYNVDYQKGKPTNSEFIATMAEKIKMSMK